MSIVFDPYFDRWVLPKNFYIETCDIFFTHGNSFVSKAIRFGEEHPGDWISVVNHTGIVVEAGSIIKANVIEALAKVKKQTLWKHYHNKVDKIAIFRPLDITNEQKRIIVDKALDYEGRVYGYFKIVAHTLDYFTGGYYIFRRIANSDNYPICSWVVANSYAKANLNFGCDPGKANPDDLWDYCVAHPTKYENILKLTNI